MSGVTTGTCVRSLTRRRSWGAGNNTTGAVSSSCRGAQKQYTKIVPFVLTAKSLTLVSHWDWCCSLPRTMLVSTALGLAFLGVTFAVWLFLVHLNGWWWLLYYFTITGRNEDCGKGTNRNTLKILRFTLFSFGMAPSLGAPDYIRSTLVDCNHMYIAIEISFDSIW